jgi:hypothetical protein
MNRQQKEKMKLNKEYPNKKFTIRVKNTTNIYEYLIISKVYQNNDNDFFVKYNGKFHKLFLTRFAPYVGTITIF